MKITRLLIEETKKTAPVKKNVAAYAKAFKAIAEMDNGSYDNSLLDSAQLCLTAYLNHGNKTVYNKYVKFAKESLKDAPLMT